MKKLTNKRGFTLIEVVLVLAIGGLIFLLAFVAFQQVSRNRRDTQRRADAGRVLAELVNYSSNNGGSYPGLGTGTNVHFLAGDAATGDAIPMKSFINDYMKGASFKDPRGTPYRIGVGPGGAFVAATVQPGGSVIGILPGYVCGSDGNPASGTSNSAAVLATLENGASSCRDSR